MQQVLSFDKYQSSHIDSLLIERLDWELNFLNKVESLIDESALISLHFDMIVNRGLKAVAEYHRKFESGTNVIVEEFKKRLTQVQASRLDENVADATASSSLPLSDPFSSAFGSAINQYLTKSAGLPTTVPAIQSTIATSQPAAAVPSATPPVSGEMPGAVPTVDPGFDAAIDGTGYIPKTDKSITSFLKQLWNALTEDGSGIGILHLVLDVIGLFGDVIPGVGVAADLLNASIYFFRAMLPNAPEGMVTFGIISLISAVIPGVGDSFKIFKPVTKPVSRILSSLFKGGNKQAAEELAKVPAKNKGLTIKFLKAIAKYSGKAFATATSILGKFSSRFVAKVSNYIPFIGAPLGKFFTRVGDVLDNFSKRVAKASDEIGTMTAKAETKATADATADAMVDGVVMAEKSSVKTVEKVNGRLARFFKYPRSRMVKWLAFLGKQVIRIMGVDLQSGSGVGSEEAEIIAGSAAFTSWVQEERIKQMKERGATYIPDFMIDAHDDEAVKKVVETQNAYARMMGQPTITHLVYDKFKNEKVEDDFADLWKQIGEGTIKRENVQTEEEISSEEETPETVDSEEPEEIRKNESLDLKHIIPFSKFSR